EDRIDEPGLVALGARREELDADVELLDSLLEASHVAARDGGDEARVAARPQIGGVGARRGLARALEGAVQRARDRAGQGDRLRLPHLHAGQARTIVERPREELHLVAEGAEPIVLAGRYPPRPQLEACVQLEVAIRRIAETLERIDAGLVERHRRAVARLRLRLRAGAIEI